MAGRQKRVVSLKVLPGQPTDGTGIACIHLFVQDERGPVVEPYVLHQKMDECGNPVKGQLVARPTRGRLACSPTRRVEPQTRGGVTTVTMRTDHWQAVTCLKCKQSKEYIAMSKESS